MTAIAQQPPAQGNAPAAPALGQLNQAELEQWKIADLRTHYLQKQREMQGPLRAVMSGIAVIASVAAAVFSSFAGFNALLFGLGICCILVGISQFTLNRLPKYNINREAADALCSPGFYQSAQENPRQLASAEAIVAAHQQWMRG